MKFNSFTIAVTRSWLLKVVRAVGSAFCQLCSADKRMMIMKLNLTLFILFLTFMQVSAEGFAQKITLERKNVTLERVFQFVEKQTQYVFVHNSEELRNTRIDISVKNVSIEELMEKCLKNLPFTYKIVKHNILVKKAVKSGADRETLIPIQQSEVRGKVTDERGITLPGVSVKIKGTAVGTVTDAQGQFSISASDQDAILVFSYIGYIMHLSGPGG